MTDAILSNREGGILTLTFHRLDKKNAITRAMYSALAQALEEAAADDTVRVAVIQGDPTCFTAGNDLMDFLSNPPDMSPGAEPAPVVRFLAILRDFPKPLIAAVAGPAVGIGTTLLLHCDLVYAGDNAGFSLPFVNLGLCPEAGSSLLAPRLMGHARASEALLLGEPFQAEAALEMGLVNRIVPPTEVNALAQRQAAKLAGKPMSSLLETKRLLKQTQARDIQVRMAEEASSFGRMLQEPAAKEAFTAFMEKRAPDFSKC